MLAVTLGFSSRLILVQLFPFHEMGVQFSTSLELCSAWIDVGNAMMQL